MLEQPALRVEQAADGPGRWWILEAASGRRLGLARPRRISAWLRWLSWPTLEVCESDDESLLFTLDRYRGLWTTWLVRDADGRLVGRIQGSTAWDALGRPLAYLEPTGAGVRRWRAPHGAELAVLQTSDAATVVTFTADCGDNPFSRMLLLAEAFRQG